MSNSVQPHRQQPTRLPRPWDSPGKNSGVGCHFLPQSMKMKSESEVTQSCLPVSDPMDRSLPGSPVHKIFQARVLGWGTISFSRLINLPMWLFVLSSLLTDFSCPTLFGYRIPCRACEMGRSRKEEGKSTVLMWPRTSSLSIACDLLEKLTSRLYPRSTESESAFQKDPLGDSSTH